MAGAVDFEGLVAIVTGGASGIGAATVRKLLERGAKVAVLDRVIKGIPEGSVGFVCDVADTATVDTSIACIAERFGSVDVVVNNAGIGSVGDVAANDDAEWSRLFDINVTGIARVTRAALPHLRRSAHAVVVNTCSAVAFVGVPQRALYTATKGAVAALTLAMAADHIGEGIRVNAVAPGTVNTPWVRRLLDAADDPDEAARGLRARQPLGTLVSADEVAFAILSLASPLAASTTGAILRVDGGMTNLRL